EVQLPAQRSPLPAGSEALQELYLLGHNQTAWERWQVEFDNHQEATVSEQFTDGLMRLGVGDNLDGIYMVSSLSWRDHPEDQAQYQTLKDNPDYWQALYPFPFADLIQTWSLERQLNPLLVTALIRQESRFEPNIRSVVGAAGLMQVMPETAAWIQDQAGIPDYNLDNPNDNVSLGTWYLDYTHREYDNHSLFAVASYNAGPGAVADWISRGGFADADEFVEKIPYPETKGYVHSVFGGYWNYLRLYNPEVAEQVSQYQSRSARTSAVSHSAVSH
ncbi:MAG: lytic transglycosylase domain-containing protein, partial [Cyanobacteria bacterium Co-bin13]|nr:lytic transglycosylase domain-containing protein [Cyanobacteria bacterium Co-bin13]